MTKYLNFFESESGFTEAVEAGELFYPNVSYTEDDDTVHWNLTKPVNPVETPMLRMYFSTSTPGQVVALRNHRVSGVTAIEIDGTPLDIGSGGTYSIAEPGNHTAVYQFASPMVPRGVFWSESGAFDAFTSAEITSAVTSIDVVAFEGCGGLSAVTIPDSVTSIGDGAFEESGLRYINIKDTVTWLGGFGAFKGCAQMRSAVIGSGITSIPSVVFADCTSLQSVTLPGNLRQINQGAFSGCSSLHDISIPSGVTRIEHQAFMGCSGLTAVYFNSQVPPLLGGSAFTATNDCPIYVPAGSVDTYKEAWPEYATRIKTKHTVTVNSTDDMVTDVEFPREGNRDGTFIEGDTADFNFNLPEELQLVSVQASDCDGNSIEVSVEDGGDGYHYCYFTMPGCDVSVFITIKETEKQKEKHTVTVDSTDGMVNPDDINFMSEDGEPSFLEGKPAIFAIRLPEGYQAVSAQASDCDGNSIEVGVEDQDDGMYLCIFTMPGCDVSVFITVEEKPEGQYKISKVINDDSLGVLNVQETASEGDDVGFDVEVFEMDRYQVSSVSITDGNGDEVEHEGDDGYYFFTMPASDVTINVVIGEKPKHTVTVDSTDGMLGGFEFMSDDGQPSYKEGDMVNFTFNFDDPDGMFQVGSVQASDCDGNSIEANLDDHGEGHYECRFPMPGCDVNVFITIKDTRPKYNISASVNDSSLGEVRLDKEALPKGELADIHIDVFNSEANSITSVTVTDGNGNNVECTKDYWDFSHYYFTMPASDVTVSVVIGDKIPEYNISASLNDDSLGRVRVSRTPLPEGEYGGFEVYLNDEEQYQISSVAVTDGNGNNVEYSSRVDADYTHWYLFKMPASDVTAFVTIEKKQ